MGWPEIKTDISLPENAFRFEHPDGRMDSFILIEGEVIFTHLTKLDDPPNWSCPACSMVNDKNATECECCGLQGG